MAAAVVVAATAAKAPVGVVAAAVDAAALAATADLQGVKPGTSK